MLTLSVIYLMGFQAPENFEVVKFHDTLPIPGGTPVLISNPYGDVRTRPAGNQILDITANIQRLSDDPVKCLIKQSLVEGRAVIDVSYTSVDSKSIGAAWIRRADITVFVPENSPLEVKGRDHLVEVKGHRSSFSTDNGDGPVSFEATGPVLVKTFRADIDGRLTNGTWAEDSHVVTTLGNIRIGVTPLANLGIDINTKGVLSSDFTMAVEWLGRERRKRANIEIGTASQSLHISSDRGDVALFRLE